MCQFGSPSSTATFRSRAVAGVSLPLSESAIYYPKSTSGVGSVALSILTWEESTSSTVDRSRNRECTICGRDGFQRLSTHWTGPKCDFPAVDRHRRETTEGLVLGGAKIGGNSVNDHLVTGSVFEAFTTRIADNLDWLAHSVRSREYTGDRNERYYVRTHAHPTITRYGDWVGDAYRRPPRDWNSLHTAGTWDASAGGLEWHGSDTNGALPFQRFTNRGRHGSCEFWKTPGSTRNESESAYNFALERRTDGSIGSEIRSPEPHTSGLPRKANSTIGCLRTANTPPRAECAKERAGAAQKSPGKTT